MEAQARAHVFISYSHADHKHLRRLKVHLKQFERRGVIDEWDDTKIQVGAKWREEIAKALKRAVVAVLLVSADFLASDFIANHELPPLLAAAESQGTTIFIVIVKPCAFEDTELAKYQAINPPSKPLEGLSTVQREAIWTNVARQIRDATEMSPVRSEKQQPTISVEVSLGRVMHHHDLVGRIVEDPLPQQEIPLGLGTALKAYKNAAYLDTAPSTVDAETESLDDLLSRGVALRERSHFQSAEEVLQRVVELSPERADAWLELARVLFGQRKLEAALDALSRVLALKPDSFKAYHGLGLTLMKLSRHEEALDNLHKALYFAPTNPEIYSNMGLLLSMMGREEEALSAYKRAVELDPESVGLLLAYGGQLEAMDRFTDALDVYSRAEAADPSNLEARENKAWLLENVFGQHEEALELARSALSLDENSTLSLEVMRDALLSLGKDDEARAVDVKLRDAQQLIRCRSV